MQGNVFDKWREIINLKSTTDVDRTISEIYANIPISGYNVWLLVCSGLLASIGLDTNSAAVIIGAMLISPLMSPILGVGLSLGINDREMFWRSLTNLFVATLFSLVTSCIYFFLTPLGAPTSEILARTQPTLLDVLVALFGGVAGIVSGSRYHKTNAIPGVAIATALMPPLCTAGFGIATGNWPIFFGAFYLFFINAVFISLATFIIVKYLEFPLKSYIDRSVQRRVTRLMTLLLLVVVLPSIYFLLNVYQERTTRKTVEDNIIRELTKKNYDILKWSIVNLDSSKEVKIYLTGKEVPEAETNAYRQKLKQMGLGEYKLRISNVNVSRTEIERMSSEIAQNFLKTIELHPKVEAEAPAEAADTTSTRNTFYREIDILFPEIRSMGTGELVFNTDSTARPIKTVVVYWQQQTPRKDRQRIYPRLYEYLKLKFEADTLNLMFYPQ